MKPSKQVTSIDDVVPAKSNERAGPVMDQPPSADDSILGDWDSGGRFRFRSPQSERSWIIRAYRQGVHHADWPNGPIMDRSFGEVAQGIGAASGFYGPDGQFRLHTLKTIEDPVVRSIKARNLKGAIVEDVKGPELPGEQEGLKYVLRHKDGGRRLDELQTPPTKPELLGSERVKSPEDQLDGPTQHQTAGGILPPMESIFPPANDNFCPRDSEQDEACKEIYEELRQLRTDILMGRADDTSAEARADYNRAATYYNESCVPFGHPELPLF